MTNYVLVEKNIENTPLPSPLPQDMVYVLPDSYYVSENASDQENKTQEIVRSQTDYITPVEPYIHYHSALKNQFYKSLSDSLVEEQKNLNDRAYVLSKFFDLMFFDGDETHFIEKVGSLFELMDFTFANFFTQYANSPISSERNIDREHDFLRRLAESIPIRKKYAGSLYSYNLPFKIVRKLGAVQLATEYNTSENFTIETQKPFRFMNIDSLINALPGGDIFPSSPHIPPVKDFAYISPVYLRWDTGNIYDDTPPLQYDTSIAVSDKGKSIFIEYSLNEILKHNNTFSTNKCLMDTPWLDLANSMLPTIKRARDKVSIGSQITLVADYENKFNSLSLDPNYSHPNIEAKFQTLRGVWENPEDISYIKVGSGGYGNPEIDNNVFISIDEKYYEKNPTIPTELQNPLFESYVGPNEKNHVGDYLAITPTFKHKEFKNEKIINTPITINGKDVLDGNIVTTTISTIHKTLTPGSCKFLIEFQSNLYGEEIKQYIEISEKLNITKGIYDPIVKYFHYNGSYKQLIDDNTKALSGYIDDNNYSADTTYLPSVKMKMYDLVPIAGETNTYGYPLYAKIDHLNGQITINIKYNAEGILKDIIEATIPSATINTDVYHTYKINSSNSISKVSEVGLYNSNRDLVAYGTFPPIIYDSTKYHLSFNILAKKGIRDTPTILGVESYWMFDDETNRYLDSINSNDLIAQGTTVVSGVIGSAIYLNGTSDYMYTSYSNSNLSGDICFMYKSSQSTTGCLLESRISELEGSRAWYNTDPVWYVDNSSTLSILPTDNEWHFISLSLSSIDARILKFGVDYNNINPLEFTIDEIRLYTIPVLEEDMYGIYKYYV